MNQATSEEIAKAAKSKLAYMYADAVNVEVLRRQRDCLLSNEVNPSEIGTATIEGVVNLLDAMIDNYDAEYHGKEEHDLKMHKEFDEHDLRHAPSGASGTLHDRCDKKSATDTLYDMCTEKVKVQDEKDPYGLDQHQSGAKLDQGKLRPALVLGNFPYALEAVTQVGTYGANKYTGNGWKSVPNGLERYHDAAMRHWLKYMSGDRINFEDGEVSHLAQVIWNLMSVYELSEGGLGDT